MKKNLLVISPWFPQINTNKHHLQFVKEYVELMEKEFENIYIIAPQPFFPKKMEKIKKLWYYSNMSNFIDFKYKNISVYYPKFLAIPGNFFRKFNGIKMFKKAIKLIKKYSIKFDIIHAHFMYPSWYAAAKIKELYPKKKLIITAHEGNINYSLSKANSALKQIKFALEKANTIQAVWESNQEKINNFIDMKFKDKTQLMHNFININKFKPKDQFKLRKKLKINKNDIVILSIANIIFKKKWQDDLLKAFNICRKENPNIKLIFIWGWQDQNKLQELINKNQYKEDIYYIGKIQNTQTIKYYNLCDIYAFPSRFESFGIVQIEAMACWKPVIAYKNWWSEHILKEPYLWKLIELQSHKVLSQELKEMIKNISTYDSKKIREYIVNNFSQEVAKNKLKNIYTL